MADQRENDVSPTGLGLSFNDEPNAIESQHDAFEGPREVEDLTDENFDDFDRDFTNNVENRAEPLRVTVDNAPADAHEANSQPGSAFSPSSSEGDRDAEVEVEEQDEDDNDFEQAEEWHDVDTRDPSSLPPFEAHPVYPAIRGRDHGDGTTDIYRVDPRTGGRRSPLHPDNGQHGYGFRRKMDGYSLRTSKRQRILTSPPVSPDYNTGMPVGIGVIPEPSPEAEEDSHVVSPLSQHEFSKSALEQHSSASKRVWSEEDEEDMSWVSVAIADVATSRRGSTENFAANMPEHDDEGATVPESSDDTVDPLSPVSPLDKAGALDALKDDSDPGQYPESSQESAAVFSPAPVYVPPPSNMRDPTSPDPEGPELLTGLTPQQGIDAWWAWHDQLDRPSIKSNRNPYNQDKTGDLNIISDSLAVNEATNVLSKQRFLLNTFCNKDITCVSNAMSDVERTREYMKLQMLKYRSQRNTLRSETDYLEGRISRRDQTIQEQLDRIARRDETIQDQDEEIHAAKNGFFNAMEAVKSMGIQKEKAEQAVKAMSAEKEKLARVFEEYQKDAQQKIDKAQRELGSRKEPLQFASIMTVISQEPVAGDTSEKDTLLARNESLLQEKERLQMENERLIAQLSESLVSRSTLDKTCTALYSKVAELEQDLVNKASEELKGATEIQMQAEADELRAQLQKKAAIESELAACKTHSAQLQSRKDDFEIELENSAMACQTKAGLAAVKDSVEAAVALAQDRQATIERLQAEIGDWQKYADETAAILEAERDASREEASELKDALLEHGWSAYAPSRKHTTMPTTSDRGTQTERRAPSTLPRSPSKAVPAPLQETKKQPLHTTSSDQSKRWAARKEVILKSQSAVEELEARRVVREERQAAELERLDQIRQNMCAILKLEELPYVPVEARTTAVAA